MDFFILIDIVNLDRSLDHAVKVALVYMASQPLLLIHHFAGAKHHSPLTVIQKQLCVLIKHTLLLKATYKLQVGYYIRVDGSPVTDY